MRPSFVHTSLIGYHNTPDKVLCLFLNFPSHWLHPGHRRFSCTQTEVTPTEGLLCWTDWGDTLFAIWYTPDSKESVASVCCAKAVREESSGQLCVIHYFGGSGWLALKKWSQWTQTESKLGFAFVCCEKQSESNSVTSMIDLLHLQCMTRKGIEILENSLVLFCTHLFLAVLTYWDIEYQPSVS